MSTRRKIRHADDTISSVQEVLDKAQAGLRTADQAAETAEKAGRHPVMITLVGLVLAGAVMMLVRGLRDDS
ncbi:MAG: hypothetical protein WAN34_09335 [Acidimicrobiia bacterium]